MHDVTHYTAFESMNQNRILAFLINVATGIPSAIAFGRYHWEHHENMGDPKRDADLPTDWEIRTFNTPLRKFIFLLLEPLFYGLRPYFVIPKLPTAWELANIIFIIFTDCIIY